MSEENVTRARTADQLEPARSAIREAVLVTVCCLAYSILCAAAPVRPSTAIANARWLLDIEERLGIDVEPHLNAWLSSHTTVTMVATGFYTTAFFGVTILTLVILWVTDRRHYRFQRRVLFTMTFAAMATYWLFPVAPPRLLGDGAFVDSVQTHLPWGDFYSEASVALSNQYGAMPSMHTGWSVWVAIALGGVFVKWWHRLLLALYPTVTVLVILATANHYLLDAVAGLAYCLLALGAVTLHVRARRHLGRTSTA